MSTEISCYLCRDRRSWTQYRNLSVKINKYQQLKLFDLRAFDLRPEEDICIDNRYTPIENRVSIGYTGR